MMFEVSQRFYFDAAHTLAREIEAEASKRIHGHTYEAEIALRGEPDPQTGMVVDLGHLRGCTDAIRARLDHHFLDEVDGLGKPTLERLCLFIAAQARDAGFAPCRVSVWRERTGDRCDLML